MKTPLQIAREAASEKISRHRLPEESQIVSLNIVGSRRTPGSVIYLRASTRDRLAKLSYLMAVSFSDAIAKLSTLEYEAAPELHQLGVAPTDDVEPRTVRVRATIYPEADLRYQEIARKVEYTNKLARSIATSVVDLILAGKIRPVGYASLEEAAETALRRDPLERVASTLDDAVETKTAYGRIILRLSPVANRGLIAIVTAFDKRRTSTRTRSIVTALANLPVEYKLVNDILDIPRVQRAMVLPLWVIDKFARMGLDLMLVPNPVLRRPSTLVSSVLEYIGQGAIQAVHSKRSLTSIDALKEAAEIRREQRRRVAP